MSQSTGSSGLLRSEDAAEYLRLSKSTLAKMRMRGDGPTFMKLGSRIVVYRVADLNAWLQQSTMTSTAKV